MPKFTILLMPFALVGILEMRGWSHHLAPEPGVSQSFREQNAGAPSAIFCQLPPQSGAGQKIAPGHESLEEPQRLADSVCTDADSSNAFFPGKALGGCRDL